MKEYLKQQTKNDPLFLHKLMTVVGAVLGFIVGIFVVRSTEEVEDEDVLE